MASSRLRAGIVGGDGNVGDESEDGIDASSLAMHFGVVGIVEWVGDGVLVEAGGSSLRRESRRTVETRVDQEVPSHLHSPIRRLVSIRTPTLANVGSDESAFALTALSCTAIVIEGGSPVGRMDRVSYYHSTAVVVILFCFVSAEINPNC